MKCPVLVLCLLFELKVFALSSSNKLFRTVSTENGLVRGVQKRSVFGRLYFSFQGIPYMKPPLGKLRFTAPEPPVKWRKPLDATKESPAFTQIDTMKRKLVGQEDAGVINVYTPVAKMYSSLPVLVWIHGGSFQVSLVYIKSAESDA
jgi:carboxylesterase type B